MKRTLFLNTSDAGIAAKDSIPSAVAKTGTIASNGTKVTGTNTLFLTEVTVGDFIYGNDQVRKVVQITTNTELYVEAAFSANIGAGAALKTVRRGVSRFVVKNTGAGNAKVYGSRGAAVTLPAGAEISVSENDHNPNGVEPVAYDKDASTLLITIVE